MKGWKTALVALLITLFGGMQAFFESVEMEPTTQGWVLMGIGVVMTTLRAVSNTPIFSAEE